MHANNQALPAGMADFAKLRSRSALLVDKTDLIAGLATACGDQVFLARPRRFGKTLLTSTLKTLFEGRLERFHGMKIDGRWHEKPHDVVTLDFSKSASSFSSAAEFEAKFWNYVEAQCAAVGYAYDPKSLSNPENQFDLWLQSRIGNPLVLLIDECDAALNHSLSDPELYSGVQARLRVFFSTLKSNEGALRFLFLTGTARHAFLGINSLIDVSSMPAFGTLLGFTEDELLECFDEPLERASRILGLALPTLIDELSRCYGGFCFDASASSRVLNPWSVLRFLMAPECGFVNYRHESAGEPAFLMNALNGIDIGRILSLENGLQATAAALRAPLMESDLFTGLHGCGSQRLDEIALLLQAGCLTVKRAGAFGQLTLDIPNRETRDALARLCARARAA